MNVHPAADLFPMMDPAAFAELKQSIAAQGLRVPVIVWDREGQEDMLLDGRNRLRACEETETEVEIEPFHGDAKAALDLVIALNLHRRHLGTSQRALIAAKLETLKNGQRKSATQNCIARPEAARLLNVSERSVASAAKVLAAAKPETIAKVERGELGVNAALAAVTRGEVPSKAGARGRSRSLPSNYEKALRAVQNLTDQEWQRLKKEMDT